MFVYVPFALAVSVLFVLALTPLSRRADRVVNRVAWAGFHGEDIDLDAHRERYLRAAGIGTPYRLYQAKTYLFTAAGAFCGGVLGVYAGGFLVDALDVTTISSPIAGDIFSPLPAWLLTFDVKFFVVLLLSAVSFGGITAGVVFAIQWRLPSIRAETRRRQIDAGMPRVVAFVYALSRGGMAFPEVMRTLSRNEGVFGTSAAEMQVGVRNIDLFGDDLVTAVRDLSRRTPSEQFQKFTENLSSVLQSGRNLSEFLHDEYERYRSAAEEQQREILDLLATTAEIYVTVVVAGMLFLVTILLVIGLTSGGMLLLLQVVAYALLPATNVLFIAALSEITQPLRATRDTLHPEDVDQSVGRSATFDHGAGARADGGAPLSADSRANLGRLRASRRMRRVLGVLSDPFQALIQRPTLVFYVTVPLALAFVLSQLPAVYVDGRVAVAVLDDVLVQATLFLTTTFAFVYEVSRRRLERLEESVPDLLERLASLNEAGVSVVSSFDRVRRSDVGELDEEVERIWRDIRWGATVEQALDRFEARVRTPAVTRVVTLVTNAMRASNEIGPVLRIAAEQARSDRRLKRQREQEMFTYLVVIYVAFFVYLVVIGAIDYVLIPNLPTAEPSTAGEAVSSAGFVAVTQEDVEQYRLVFFHAGIVQATLSGLVGGQMGSGSLKDGVKHASIMLTIAYAVFLFAQEGGVNATAAMLPLPV